MGMVAEVTFDNGTRDTAFRFVRNNEHDETVACRLADEVDALADCTARSKKLGATSPPTVTGCALCCEARCANAVRTDIGGVARKVSPMLSRRSFLNRTLGAGLALAGSQQVAAQDAGRPTGATQNDRRCAGACVEAGSPRPSLGSGPWRSFPEPFTIEKLAPMMDEAGVDRVVIVPPSWEGDRNDYALEAVKRYPGRFAVMGRIPLQNPQSAALLPKWKEQPGMLGIRVTFQRNWPPGSPTEPPIGSGRRSRSGPSGHVSGGRPGAQFARIAERHPQLILIIDHMGLTADTPRTCRRRSSRPSRLLNTRMYRARCPRRRPIRPEPYPFRDMKPLRRVIEAFGPQRCYWGADLTNSLAKASYRQRITHFTEELDFLSASDKEWIMGRGFSRAWAGRNATRQPFIAPRRAARSERLDRVLDRQRVAALDHELQGRQRRRRLGLLNRGHGLRPAGDGSRPENGDCRQDDDRGQGDDLAHLLFLCVLDLAMAVSTPCCDPLGEVPHTTRFFGSAGTAVPSARIESRPLTVCSPRRHRASPGAPHLISRCQTALANASLVR